MNSEDLEPTIVPRIAEQGWSASTHKIMKVETFDLRDDEDYSAGSVVITKEDGKVTEVNLVYLEPNPDRAEMFVELGKGNSIKRPMTIAPQKKMIEECQAFLKDTYDIDTTAGKKRTDTVGVYQLSRHEKPLGFVRIHYNRPADKHIVPSDWVYFHDLEGKCHTIATPFSMRQGASSGISATIDKMEQMERGVRSELDIGCGFM